MGRVVRPPDAAGGPYEKDPSTGATKKYYRFAGRLIAVRDSATGLHSLHQDHLGSTSLQTTAGGAYEDHEFRGPFGQPLTAGGSFATDLKYTEQRSLESSLGSLYFYKSRWYSPALGRFLQPDSIVPNRGLPQDLNPFAYVRNNPLKYSDPAGHRAVDAEGDPEDGWSQAQAQTASALIEAYQQLPNPIISAPEPDPGITKCPGMCAPPPAPPAGLDDDPCRKGCAGGGGGDGVLLSLGAIAREAAKSGRSAVAAAISGILNRVAPSAVLAQNMTGHGVQRPAQSAAHHIVAHSADGAQR